MTIFYRFFLCLLLLTPFQLSAQALEILQVEDRSGNVSSLEVKEYRLFRKTGHITAYLSDGSERRLDPLTVRRITGVGDLLIESIREEDGSAAFYQLLVTGPSEVFYGEQDHVLVRKRGTNERMIRLPIRENIRLLAGIVSDCHYMTEEFLSHQRTEGLKSLTAILLKYNRCGGDQEARVLPRRLRSSGRVRSLSLGLLAGVGFNTASTRQDGTFRAGQDFTVSPSPRVGVSLRSNAYGPRLGLHMELALTRLSIEADNLELEYATGVFDPYFYRVTQLESRLGAHYRLSAGPFLRNIYVGASPLFVLDREMSQTSTFHVIQNTILNERVLNLGAYAGATLVAIPLGSATLNLEADVTYYRTDALSIDPLSHSFSIVRMGLSANYQFY